MLTDALVAGRRGLELADTGQGLIGRHTVRDAVLIGVSDLSPEGRTAAEVAAVAGEDFDLAVVACASSSAGLAELLSRQLVIELPAERSARLAADDRFQRDARLSPGLSRRRLTLPRGEARYSARGQAQ